jgi:[acyl-carrier-protein] S-malonyltransferase
MQEAVGPGVGAMAAILGLSRSEVERVCDESRESGIVSPANMNSPVQIVIAGEKKAVERAGERALKSGAKRVIPLPVSVPSHCRLMHPASERLAVDLERIRWNGLSIPVVANVHARLTTKPEQVREALVQQLEAPVLWVDCMKTIWDQGIRIFVEVGPGKVLSGLGRRILEGAEFFNAEDSKSVEKTVMALKPVDF